MANRLSPGCNCCGCLEFSDTFNRANSTNVGSDWTEEVGDWSISSNTLQVSSANARILLVPIGTEQEMVVGITFRLPAQGDQIRLILDYQDEDNYHFAQFTRGNQPTSVQSVVKLFIRAAGVETELASKNVGFGLGSDGAGAAENVLMEVCLVNGRLTCVAAADAISLQLGTNTFADTTPFGVPAFALGTDTLSGTAIIDTYLAEDITADCAECSGCGECHHTNSGNQVDITGTATHNGTFICNLGSVVGNGCNYTSAVATFPRVDMRFNQDTGSGATLLVQYLDPNASTLLASWSKAYDATNCDLEDFELGPGDLNVDNDGDFGGATVTVNYIP